MKSEIIIFGTVRGLASEENEVLKMVDEFKPDAVAISISKEQLEAMIEHVRSGKKMAVLDNVEEDYYVSALRRFGEVSKPPPSFVKAWQLCDDRDIPLYPVDFDDVEFTDLYCHYVSGMEWLRQPSKERAIARKRFTSRTPKEFVLEWDELVNRTKGLRKMENAREEKIARETGCLAEKYGKVMLVVDFERSGAVAELLKEAGCVIPDLTI